MDVYNLCWDDHKNSMSLSVTGFFNEDDFVDVTLACEGEQIKAHKVVLSSGSTVLKKLLKDNPCQHPIIILKGMKASVIRLITSFIYVGAVDVPEDLLTEFFDSALSLEVNGLTDAAKEHGRSQKQPTQNNTDDAVPTKRPRLDEAITNSFVLKQESPKPNVPDEKDRSPFQLPFAQTLNRKLSESERIENIKADLEHSSRTTFPCEPSPGPSQDPDVLVLLETESLAKKTDSHLDKSPIAASSPGGLQATSPMTGNSVVWENETCIWQGNLAFHSKQRQHAEKVAHYVGVKVFSKVLNFQPVVNASSWPTMLHLQLVPSKLLPSLFTGEIKHRGSLVKLIPSICNDTQLLVRALRSSYVGCVYLKDTRDTPASHLEILLLTVSSDKKSLVGFIPKEQQLLINHLRKTFQESKDSRSMSPNTSQGQLLIIDSETSGQVTTGRTSSSSSELLRHLLQTRQPAVSQQQPVSNIATTVQNVSQQQQIPVGTVLAPPQNVFLNPLPPTSVQMIQQPVVLGNPVNVQTTQPTSYVADEPTLLDLLNL